MTESLKNPQTIAHRRIDRGIPLLQNEPGNLAELFLQSAEKHDLAAALNFEHHIAARQKSFSSD